MGFMKEKWFYKENSIISMKSVLNYADHIFGYNIANEVGT